MLPILLCVLAFAADPDIGTKGFTHGFVMTSDGVRIHYLENGSGPAMLFVPGWTGAAEFWAPQMRDYAATHRVIAMDPRSQGDSEKTGEGNGTVRRARDIHEVIEKLKLAPVVLVAWSRAVPESMNMIEQFVANHLLAIVLVDGNLFRTLTAESARRFFTESQAMSADRKTYTLQQVPGMFRRPHSQEFYAAIAAINRKTPTPVAITLQADALESDTRPALRKLDRPALFINRDGDGAVAVKAAVSKELPTARLEIMDGLGHALFLDDVDRFNAILDDFLRSLSR